MIQNCPKCGADHYTKAGIVGSRQRYKCGSCNYHFTVSKEGKSTDVQIVKRALQLYVEGMSYREIESVLGVSHVSVMNWVKKYKVERPVDDNHHVTHQLMPHQDVVKLVTNREFLHDTNVLISRVNGHYMVLTFGSKLK